MAAPSMFEATMRQLLSHKEITAFVLMLTTLKKVSMDVGLSVILTLPIGLVFGSALPTERPRLCKFFSVQTPQLLRVTGTYQIHMVVVATASAPLPGDHSAWLVPLTLTTGVLGSCPWLDQRSLFRIIQDTRRKHVLTGKSI